MIRKPGAAGKDDMGDVEEADLTCKNVIVKWLSAGEHKGLTKKMLDNILLEREGGQLLGMVLRKTYEVNDGNAELNDTGFGTADESPADPR